MEPVKSIVAVLALLISVFIPAQQASSATVTKEVLVKNSLGNPVENASVAIIGVDPALNEYAFPNIASTNSEGLASITWDTSNGLVAQGIAVQPSGFELSAFQGLTEMVTNDTNQTGGGNNDDIELTVTLEASTMRVHPKIPGGESAPIGTRIDFPSKQTIDGSDIYLSSTAYVLSPGPIGLNLALEDVEQPSYNSLSVKPVRVGDYYPGDYAVFDGNSGFEVVKPDIGTTTIPISANGDGEFELFFDESNVAGQLTDVGNSFSLPTGVTASVHIMDAQANGKPFPGRVSSAFVDSDGSFSGYVNTFFDIDESTKEVVAVVMMRGDTDFPTFVSDPFTVSRDDVENGFTMDIPIGNEVPNLSMQVVDENGDQRPSFIYVEDFSQSVNFQDGIFYGPEHVPNGLASISIPDGNYQVLILPFDAIGDSDQMIPLELEISSDIATLTKGGISVFKDENEIYQIDPSLAGFDSSLDTTNSDLAFEISNVTGGMTVRFYEGGTIDNPGLLQSSNGTDQNFIEINFETDFGSLLNDDGIYIVEVIPDDLNFGSTYFELNYLDGGVDYLVDEDGDNVDVSGIIEVLAPASSLNFVVQAEDENGDPISNGFVQIYETIGFGGADGDLIGFKNLSGDGEIGFELNDGAYNVYVSARENLSLARSAAYELGIEDQSVSKFLFGSNNISPNGNVYPLIVPNSNVFGQLRVGEDDFSNSYGETLQDTYTADVILQKETDSNVWTDVHRRGLNSDGTYSFRVYPQGDENYRVLAKPMGRADLVDTASSTFNATQLSDPYELDIAFDSPDAVIRVVQAGSDVFERYVDVEILLDGQVIARYNTEFYGSASINFDDPGDYTIRVSPDRNSGVGVTKEYSLSVDDDFNVTIPDGTSVSGQNADTFILEFGSPNIAGVLLSPDGSSTVPFARITPYQDGEPIYEEQVSTNRLGTFQIDLGAGEYQLIASGDSIADFADSQKIGPLTVNSQGEASISGADASALEIRLSEPTWSGVLIDPTDDSPMNGGNVCINFDNNSEYPSCSWASNDGGWSIVAPEGFSGFGDDSYMSVQGFQSSALTPAEYRGKEEIEQALSDALDEGDYQWPVNYSFDPSDSDRPSYTGLNLSPKLANFTVVVEGDDGTQITDAWVSLFSPDLGFLGGNSISPDGKAYLNLDPGTDLSELLISVYLFDSNSDFSGTEQGLNVDSGEAVDDFNGDYTVILPESNFKGVLYYPDGITAAEYSHIELLDTNNNQYLPGIQVQEGGRFSASLEQGSYRLIARTPWDSTIEASKSTYFVTVDANGNITSIEDDQGDPVSPNNEEYSLELTEPNLSGTVTNPANEAVRDSRIEIVDFETRYVLWELSTFSRQDGSFSLNLDDSTYDVYADAPWNSSGLARSEFCKIEIDGGVLNQANSGSCVQNNGDVVLQLREPNLDLNLQDADGNAASYAGFGISAGGWNRWSQADSQGNVSIFVDLDEIELANPDWDPASENLTFRTNFDPAWGSSGMVSFQCFADSTAPNCPTIPALTSDATSGDVWGTGQNLDLGTVRFSEPNTSFVVRYPDGTPVGEGAWVTAFIHDLDNDPSWKSWVGGSNTDSSGTVSFDLPETASDVEYSFEVNSPWRERSNYAPQNHKLSYSDIATYSFELAEPNLTFEVVDQDDNPLRSAWIEVRKVESDSSSWYQGANPNRLGQVSVYLEPGSDYTFTIHPGTFSGGTKTTCSVTENTGVFSVDNDLGCEVETSGENPVVSLSNGNFGAQVVISDADAGDLNGTGLENAVVVFTLLDGDGNPTSETVQAITGGGGNFNVSLPEGEWQIKTLYFPRAGEFDPDSLVQPETVIVESDGDVFFDGTALEQLANIELIIGEVPVT